MNSSADSLGALLEIASRRSISSRKLSLLGNSVSGSKRARWLILASALRRSVMSSTSTTVPPTAIGWNVHDSARPCSISTSVVTIAPACEFSISEIIVLSVFGRHRSGGHACGDDIRCADAAMHEIVGEMHHFAETIVHHAKATVCAEHAQAMRHVVQRGVELAGERGFAFARDQGAEKNLL